MIERLHPSLYFLCKHQTRAMPSMRDPLTAFKDMIASLWEHDRLLLLIYTLADEPSLSDQWSACVSSRPPLSNSLLWLYGRSGALDSRAGGYGAGFGDAPNIKLNFAFAI